MKRLVFLFCLLVCGAGLAAAADDDAAPGWVLRYADIGGGHIVFTYEDDLWLVADTGGPARRITSDEGVEQFAKFSPDGTQLAFTASYDGGTDVYVMDALGGVPRRLTWHPSYEVVLGWTPDGQAILFSANREAPGYSSELYRIPVGGGMAEKVAVDRAALASMRPDGGAVAYNRMGRHVRTWKRYEGGNAQDIYVKDFGTDTTRRITDWVGSDQFPMWTGSGLYFNSDREDGTLNLYRWDPATEAVTRLTFFDNYDVKYPSVGGEKIVFQHGAGLSVLDLASDAVAEVPIAIPSDRRHVRTELITPEPDEGSFGLSPGGERALVEVRGEILNLPADEGDAVNVTRSSGSREKNAAWSPDGGRLALVSDRDGEEAVYLVDPRGEGEWKKLTKQNHGFIRHLVWSPDGEHLLFSDKFLKLHLVSVDGGEREIAASEYDDAWERWGIMDYVWSPDSRWIAYTSQTGNMNEAIWLFDTESGDSHRLTDDMHEDWSPSFSPDGKYLYFLSNRTFDPIMGRQDQNHVFLKLARPYVVLLQKGVRSPFYEEDVVVAAGDAAEEEEDKGGGKEEAGATAIDLDGLAGRVLACEGVDADDWYRLEATADGCLLLRRPEPVFLKYQNVDDHTGGRLDLVGYDLAAAETKDLMSGVANYHLSADGKKLIYRAGGQLGVVDAGKEAKPGDGKLDTGAIKLRIDRMEEFPQIFDEAWRIQRDWFYDPGMHGVDWQAMHDKYAPFVAGCGTRGDLNYLIGEMIAELNIGHTYIYGGDFEDHGPRVGTGLLGCGFAAGDGDDHHRIVDIVPGVPWDPRYRSPLTEPGVDVAPGSYLIAVDGVEVRTGDNVYAQLVDKADAMVTLTVGDRDDGKNARKVRLRTLRSEYGLRYRAWVDANLAHVTERSGGDVGYVHLPNMGEQGLTEFGRSWYPQTGKRAMIIDDRNNGGGFVGDMIIDRLDRVLWAMTQPREGLAGRNPERVFHGPLVVLVNEDTYSNGEFFAEAVKRLELATVMGVRTWGGTTGIEPHQDLVDGGGTSPPQFGLYGLDGTWPVEGWGVEPHIVVVNTPDDVVAGHDAQLDAAIDHLLGVLETEGDRWVIPPPPPYPVKAKPRMSAVDKEDAGR